MRSSSSIRPLRNSAPVSTPWNVWRKHAACSSIHSGCRRWICCGTRRKLLNQKVYRLPRLQRPSAELVFRMAETPFPSPEELQKKIQEFMKANFGEHVAVSAFTQQSSTDEAPEERLGARDPFQINVPSES